MRRYWLSFFAGCLAGISFTLTATAQQTPSSEIREYLSPFTSFTARLTVCGEPLRCLSDVEAVYSRMDYQPLWTIETANQFMDVVRNAGAEGLSSQGYHTDIIDSLLMCSNGSVRAELDILLTDAFLHLGGHLLHGAVDPTSVYPEKWEWMPRSLDMVTFLINTLSKESVGVALDSLRPKHPAYKLLMSQLDFFAGLIDEPWFNLPDTSQLELNGTYELLPRIRERLEVLGYPSKSSDSTGYDSALNVVVKQFQNSRGLKEDGVIGPETFDALNIGPAWYVDKITANLERLRWLPWPQDGNYLNVNIPSYSLSLYENGSELMHMRAIVGRPDRATPVFSSQVTYLILNPTWTVPPTILYEDVLPAVKRDSHYLNKHGLRIVDRKGNEINPEDVAWEKFNGKNFLYQLIQDPGAYNTLGLFKFHFDNRYSVFLHDTNARSLFRETRRALSSGCIRIEHPYTLALHLLSGHWDSERLSKILASRKTTTLRLPHPVPICISYFTIIDRQGQLQFLEDVYGWDALLLEALTDLQRRSPGSPEF